METKYESEISTILLILLEIRQLNGIAKLIACSGCNLVTSNSSPMLGSSKEVFSCFFVTIIDLPVYFVNFCHSSFFSQIEISRTSLRLFKILPYS